jgi:hypothetical protein
MVTREDGYVALKHYNSNPKTVKIQSDGTTYSFSSTNPDGQIKCSHLSMSWVNPDHVQGLLSHQARICCGKKSNEFLLANELDVKLWLTGER